MTKRDFNADQSLMSNDDDKLGFLPFAENLARALLRTPSGNGVVVGIFGQWGSGKSSMARLVLNCLEKSQSEPKPIVIEFHPWCYSGLDELTRAFFVTVAKALTDEKVPRGLSEGISRLGTGVGAIPVGKGAKVKDVLLPLGQIAFGDFTTLQSNKARLSFELKAQKRKILLWIDDIDRLSADEIIQLFRVIKTVADLPNVTYLLTLDRDVVANALKNKLGISGEDYLEKIIQVPFQIPALDTEGFRSMFFQEFEKAVEQFPEESFNSDYFRTIFINSIEKIVNTPRRIFRLMNTLQVTSAGIEKDVDPVQFLAVETLRLYCPTIYARLCRESSLFVEGYFSARKNTPQKLAAEQSTFAELFGTVGEHEKDAVKAMLCMLFPKVAKTFELDHSYTFRDERSKQQKEREISNPEKYPIYFQFSIPGMGVSADEALGILKKITDINYFKKLLDTLKASSRPNGSTRLSSFLVASQNVLSSLSDAERREYLRFLLIEGDSLSTLQDIGKNRLGLPFGNEISISRTLHEGLALIPSQERLEFLLEAALLSKSPGIYVHLIPDEDSPPSSARAPILSIDNLNALKTEVADMILRLANEGQLFEVAGLREVLLFWKKCGDENALQAWLKTQLVDDASFLMFVENYFSNPATRRNSLAYLTRIEEFDRQALKLADKPKLTERQKQAIASLLAKDLFERFGDNVEMP